MEDNMNNEVVEVVDSEISEEESGRLDVGSAVVGAAGVALIAGAVIGVKKLRERHKEKKIEKAKALLAQVELEENNGRIVIHEGVPVVEETPEEDNETPEEGEEKEVEVEVQPKKAAKKK